MKPMIIKLVAQSGNVAVILIKEDGKSKVVFGYIWANPPSDEDKSESRDFTNMLTAAVVKSGEIDNYVATTVDMDVNQMQPWECEATIDAYLKPLN